MRRITIWLTTTIAVAGLLLAFQLNASGSTGKSGDDGNHTRPGSTAPAGDGEHVGRPGENK